LLQGTETEFRVLLCNFDDDDGDVNDIIIITIIIIIIIITIGEVCLGGRLCQMLSLLGFWKKIDGDNKFQTLFTVRHN
jgi:hypothetical protein